MWAEVNYQDRAVGTLEWKADTYGVQVELDCEMPCGPLTLLRCYGQTDGAPLLIGLPEPKGGRLRLTRHLSRETLKSAGCLHNPPYAFYLSENGNIAEREEQQEGSDNDLVPEASAEQTAPEARLSTGDLVLDSLLEQGGIAQTAEQGGIELRCAFMPDKPFPLAPAFVLCTVQDGQAVLHWTKKDAAGGAASQ